MQSPVINKIANPCPPTINTNIYDKRNDVHYVLNAAQKRKVSTKALDKNKISPNNKSIVKPSILNQPNNLRSIKQQKKAIRDTRRRKISEDQAEEMDTDSESNNIEETNPNETSTPNNENRKENNNISDNESQNTTKLNDIDNNSNSNNLSEQNPTQSIIKRKIVNKKNMTDIQMINSKDRFSITKEAQNLFPHINLAQLLSASPSLRKELELGCKPKTEKVVCSFTSSNVPLIIGEIEGKYLRILYDTGANINVITTSGLNKLINPEIKENNEEQSITIANGTTVSTKFFVTLRININNTCTLIEDFYIIDYENPYFDIIFGRGIQKKYRLFIDPDDDCVYQKTKKGPKKITEIVTNNDISNSTPIMNTIIITKEEKKEFLTTVEDILKSIPDKVKPNFEKLLKCYKKCLATSLSQLSRAKLEPHSIITTTEKPIKLKPYKLSKEHSDILKNEIVSLLE